MKDGYDVCQSQIRQSLSIHKHPQNLEYLCQLCQFSDCCPYLRFWRSSLRLLAMDLSSLNLLLNVGAKTAVDQAVVFTFLTRNQPLQNLQGTETTSHPLLKVRSSCRLIKCLLLVSRFCRSEFQGSAWLWGGSER